ncbi:MAG: hypothetical protein Q8O98_01995 [bacterium]|nr:hypothetical protein [bacterium]
MSAIEIIALVTIIISVIKLVVITINPKAWYEGPLVKVWTNKVSGTLISLALGAVVLNYLLEELTIVQVFASLTFASLLFMLILIPYYRELYNMVLRDHSKGRDIFKRSWLGSIAWIALMIWVLVELF